MNNRLIITFEKSQEDIPVLIAGDKAIEIWNTLENKRKKEK